MRAGKPVSWRTMVGWTPVGRKLRPWSSVKRDARVLKTRTFASVSTRRVYEQRILPMFDTEQPADTKDEFVVPSRFLPMLVADLCFALRLKNDEGAYPPGAINPTLKHLSVMFA